MAILPKSPRTFVDADMIKINNANEIILDYIQKSPHRYLRVDSFSGECDLSIMDASHNPEIVLLQIIAADNLDDGLLELAEIIDARNTLDDAKRHVK